MVGGVELGRPNPIPLIGRHLANAMLYHAHDFMVWPELADCGP